MISSFGKRTFERLKAAFNRSGSCGNNRLTDWRALLAQDWDRFLAFVREARNGEPILIASSVVGHPAVAEMDMLLMVALAVRGANVQALACDCRLPACEHQTLQSGCDSFLRARLRCRRCYGPAAAAYARLGLPVLRYGDFLDSADYAEAARLAKSVPLADIPGYSRDGIRLGEHALAGALRFFARGTLDAEPLAESVLRRYLHAALLTASSVSACLRQCRFTKASFHHGIYIPQGVVSDVCRAHGVDVINWQVAYRKKSFIFSHKDTYHHTLLQEKTSEWENLEWSERLERLTMDYIDSRRRGTNDWIYFHEKPTENFEIISKELGLNASKPMIGLLTNVIWDAQLHYPANAFNNMTEWLLFTIAHFAMRPELQLVIRVHPAEISGAIKSRQLACDEIKRTFPLLPDNVALVGPEKKFSTYSLMQHCNAVIIYGTKTGVELTSMGVPVIVAGEAWIRNKGLTLDAVSKEEYEALLRRLPLSCPLDAATVERARKYAFHFFFRRMIPVNSIEATKGKIPYAVRIGGLDDLLPGKDPGLDVITRGIMTGSPFVYPYERIVAEEPSGCSAGSAGDQTPLLKQGSTP